MMMTKEEITTIIQNVAPEAVLEESKQYLTFSIPSKNSRALLEALRNNEDLLFDYLFCLTGVDRAETMEVVYHLKSTRFSHEVVVRGIIDSREKPEIPTVSDIWRTAEFHEREAYDFYGIVFTGHPDLRRIFLEDDWVGWPMRKDYEDPINMIEY